MLVRSRFFAQYKSGPRLISTKKSGIRNKYCICGKWIQNYSNKLLKKRLIFNKDVVVTLQLMRARVAIRAGFWGRVRIYITQLVCNFDARYISILLIFQLTWVSDSVSDAEKSARSAMDKYCFSWNRRSSATSCSEVKGVLGLRLGLCLRREHFSRT